MSAPSRRRRRRRIQSQWRDGTGRGGPSWVIQVKKLSITKKPIAKAHSDASRSRIGSLSCLCHRKRRITYTTNKTKARQWKVCGAAIPGIPVFQLQSKPSYILQFCQRPILDIRIFPRPVNSSDSKSFHRGITKDTKKTRKPRKEKINPNRIRPFQAFWDV